MFKKICSRQNPLIKNIRKICQGKIPNKFIIDTIRPLEIALASKPFSVEKVLVTEKFFNHYPRLLQVVNDNRVETIIVEENIIDTLSNTKSSQGVLGIVSFQDWTISDIDLTGVTTVVICDAISDPGNLGSIIRSCDAFGIKGVIVVNNACDIYNPKVVRASAGSIMNIPVVIEDISGLKDFVKKNNFKTYAAVAHKGQSLIKTRFHDYSALIFCNEAHGISSAMKPLVNYYVTIPLLGKAESLNVASANAVFLYEVMRQKKGG